MLCSPRAAVGSDARRTVVGCAARMLQHPELPDAPPRDDVEAGDRVVAVELGGDEVAG